MTPQEYKELIKKDPIKIGQDVDDLPWDDYEGNLLNYFCGMTPQESKRFNKPDLPMKQSIWLYIIITILIALWTHNHTEAPKS